MHFLSFTNIRFSTRRLTGAVHTFNEMLRALSSDGNRVTLLAPECPVGINRSRLNHISVPRVSFLSGLLPVFIRQRSLIRKTVRSRKDVFTQRRFDALVVVGNTSGMAAIPLKKMLGCPLIVIMPEDPHEYRKIKVSTGIRISSGLTITFRPLVRLYLAFSAYFEKYLIRRADMIIVQSEFYRKRFAGRYRDHAGIFRVLPSPVETSWVNRAFKNVNRSTRLRQICFMGSLIMRKGPDVMIDAFLRAAGKHSDLRLSIYGDGPLRDSLGKTAADSVAAGRIRFEGWADDPCAVLAKYDLLVISSRSDSLPRTIGEALYAGTPVIGSRVGGIPDQLLYGELLFQPDSAEQLAGILYDLASDDDKYRTIRRKCGQRRAELDFDWGSALRGLVGEVAVDGA